MITQEQINQVKASFQNKGITIDQWAKDNNYPAWAVYRVLNGVNKGYRGKAHEIATKLGLKQQAA